MSSSSIRLKGLVYSQVKRMMTSLPIWTQPPCQPYHQMRHLTSMWFPPFSPWAQRTTRQIRRMMIGHLCSHWDFLCYQHLISQQLLDKRSCSLAKLWRSSNLRRHLWKIAFLQMSYNASLMPSWSSRTCRNSILFSSLKSSKRSESVLQAGFGIS